MTNCRITSKKPLIEVNPKQLSLSRVIQIALQWIMDETGCYCRVDVPSWIRGKTSCCNTRTGLFLLRGGAKLLRFTVYLAGGRSRPQQERPEAGEHVHRAGEFERLFPLAQLDLHAEVALSRVLSESRRKRQKGDLILIRRHGSRHTPKKQS